MRFMNDGKTFLDHALDGHNTINQFLACVTTGLRCFDLLPSRVENKTEQTPTNAETHSY